MAASGGVRELFWRLARAVSWIVLVWTVVFWRLGYLSLLDPDEAHYAQITKEMLLAREWLVPLMGGVPFIDKPVLFHWLQGAAFLLFGLNEFAARLPSALAAIALTATTYWTGRALFDRAAGRRAAAMFLTMPGTFALASIGLLDMLFAAFLFGAVACLVIAAVRGRPRLQWVGYGLLSLAIMTKGPVALLLLGAAFACAIVFVRSSRGDLVRLSWFSGPLIAAAVASPWFVWMAWHFGHEFVQHYIIEGHVWYVTHPYQFREPNTFFYVRTFFGAFAPWSLLAVGRAIDLARTRGRTATSGEWLLTCWIAAVLTVFTVARFKLDHYIFPAAPAVCLVAARAWGVAADREAPAFWQRAVVIALPFALIGGALVLGATMFDLDLQLSPNAIVMPPAVIAGALMLLWRLRRSGWRTPGFPVALVATLLVGYASVVLFGFPVLEHVRPTPAVGRWISARQPASAPVGLFQLTEWEASLRFYSDRKIEVLEDADALRRFLAEPGPRSVVMLRRHFRALRAMGAPLRFGFASDAVVGRSGKGLRRQLWGRLVVATKTGER